MTNKNKDRLINAALGIITGGAVVLFGTFITNKSDIDLETKKDIEKLKLEKVDKTSFQRYQDNHVKVHESEVQVTQQKLDLIIKLIEAKD